MEELTPKQKRFCQEYVVDFNGTQAAIKAGYSAKTSKVISSQNLTKLNVQAYIKALCDKVEKKLEVTKERIVQEYAKLAFTNLTDVVDMSSGLPVFKDLESIKSDHLAALQGVSETVTGLKFKMHDKKGALDSLAKHLGMFAEDNKREIDLRVGKIKKEDVEAIDDLMNNITK